MKSVHDHTEDLLTVKEVASKIGVTAGTIYEWVRDRKIPAVILPGGRIRFSPKAIENWVANNTIRQRAYAI